MPTSSMPGICATQLPETGHFSGTVILQGIMGLQDTSVLQGNSCIFAGAPSPNIA